MTRARILICLLGWALPSAVFGASEVRLVKDIYAGHIGSQPHLITEVTSGAYFMANDGRDVDAGYALWFTDGTAVGTHYVGDLDSPDIGLNYAPLVGSGNRLFYAAHNNIAGTATCQDLTSFCGKELWTAGDVHPPITRLVKDIRPGADSSYPSWITPYAGGAFFVADDGTHGRELWFSTGSPGSAVRLTDTYPFLDSNAFLSSAVSNGIYYFSISDDPPGDDVWGYELWRSDGTAANTYIVTDLFPGKTIHGANSSGPNHLTDVNGVLYFTAFTELYGRELWRSGGTAGNTVKVKDIFPGPHPSNSHPSQLTAVGDMLYFMADDGTGYGRELWKSGGTEGTTQRVVDLTPGGGSSTIEQMTDFNGTLYFVFDDGDAAHGKELWRSDGTALGTELVRDIGTGLDIFDRAFAGAPYQLTVVGSKLFFGARTQAENWQLWETDGTYDGTRMVAYFGYLTHLAPDQLTEVHGKLFFSASPYQSEFPEVGRELWLVEQSAPKVGYLKSGGRDLPDHGAAAVAITKLHVGFDQAMMNPAGHSAANDVTNPANYLLVAAGGDGSFATTGCLGGVAASDIAVVVNNVFYNSTTFEATLNINGGFALGHARYRLFACGSTSIENESGRKLDGNGDGTEGDDWVRTFYVRDSDGDGILDHDDATCSGVDLTISQTIYNDGETLTCQASSSITTGVSVLLEGGSHLTLIAPEVALGNGLGVEPGALFDVQ